jgi:hypothetical protein
MDIKPRSKLWTLGLLPYTKMLTILFYQTTIREIQTANALMLSAKSVIPIRDPYPRHLRKKKSRHERRDLII